MGISRRIAQPLGGVYGNRKNVGFYFHRIVTTTSGAVDATASDQTADSGVTVGKTGSETGRYTITLPVPHRKLLGIIPTLIGADDAAYGAVTVGLMAIARDDDIATDGTVEVQFIGTNAGWADAEVANGASIMLTIVVEG